MPLLIKLLSPTLIVMYLCSISMAQDAKLYKKGTTLKLTEDLHCMTNSVAQSVAYKLQLCPMACRVQLEEMKDLCTVEIELLSEKLILQEDKYLDMVSAKDGTIENIQSTAFDEISKLEGSTWGKIT